MLINVFGNSSNNSENKIDTSLFVGNSYLRTIYLESNIEGDIDLQKQYRIKNFPDPISNRDATSKLYVDNKFNDPSILKNTAHFDFNNKNHDNVRFVKINSLPYVQEHLTSKFYVDEAISHSMDEPSLLRSDPDEELELDEQDSIIPNSTLTSLRTIIEIPTKSYVDSL